MNDSGILGNSTSITACCKKKIPSTYGYYWIYESEYNNQGLPFFNTVRNQPKNKDLITQAINLFSLGRKIPEIIKLTGLSYMNIYYHVKIK